MTEGFRNPIPRCAGTSPTGEARRTPFGPPTLKQVSKLSDEAGREEQLYSAIMLSSSLTPQNKDAVISEILKTETENLTSADSENSMKK